MACTALVTHGTRWSKYCPSVGAAALFAGLYGCTTLFHIYQAIRYGKKRLCWPLIMGGLWETGALVTRALAVVEPTSEGLFDTQFALVLISPLWINAFIFVLLGRLVYYYLPSKKLLGMRTWAFGLIFVLCDVSSFAVQVVGVMFTLNIDPSAQNLGLRIYSIGTGIQQAFICVFAALLIRFVFEVKRDASLEKNWLSARRLVRMIAIVLSLISLRNLFRIIEYSGGVYSTVTQHIQTTEAYQYIFDTALMFLAMIAIHYPHPGTVLLGEDAEPPYGKAKRAIRRAQKTEKKRMKAVKKEAKRSGKAQRAGGTSRSDDIELGTYVELEEGSQWEDERRDYDSTK